MKNLKNLAKAFSLVELMVVVAVIGILVSLALPRFRTFVAKSRMAEAIHNLGVIDRLQKSYNLHWEMFGQDDVWFSGVLMGDGQCTGSGMTNKLGFRVEDCSKLRYLYEAEGASDKDSADSSGAANRRIYPGCSQRDEWEIYRSAGTSKIFQTRDLIEHCR